MICVILAGVTFAKRASSLKLFTSPRASIPSICNANASSSAVRETRGASG
jgi:hypothetical protein